VNVPRWVWWAILGGAAFLLIWGWFVLGFLSEPSAVGRMRTALVFIGAGSMVVGIAGGVISLAFLVVRYSRRK